MEKLVKLLNEYHFSGTEYVGYYLDEKENRIYFRTKVVDKGLIDEQRISDERIISKKFGFIKWLVDNDKIDQTNKFLISVNVENQKNGMGYTKAFEGYESLLMLLAIQSEPLNFLISILR